MIEQMLAVIKQRLQFDRFKAQIQTTCLNLRQIEYFVEDLQEMRSSAVDGLCVIAIARVYRAKSCARNHFGETEDRVERRAQLMAHVGQKLTLRLIGGSCGRAGFLKLKSARLQRERR